MTRVAFLPKATCSLTSIPDVLQTQLEASRSGAFKLPRPLTEKALLNRDLLQQAWPVVARCVTADTGYKLNPIATIHCLIRDLPKGLWDPELHKLPTRGGGRLWMAGDAEAIPHVAHILHAAHNLYRNIGMIVAVQVC